MENNLTSLNSLLEDFRKIKLPTADNITLLEIAGIPHHENIWSNILAFYLNPYNEHQLKSIILMTLLEFIDKQFVPSIIKKITVTTEYKTANNNRIDIVIIGDNFVLGIENKVNATLYNDLNDYAQTIDKIGQEMKLRAFKVVLSKYKNTTDYGFINIIYKDFISRIKENIKNFNRDENIYYLFLKDFIKNIEKNIYFYDMEENKEIIDFLCSNVKDIELLLSQRNKLLHNLSRILSDIDNLIISSDIKATINNPKIQFVGASSDKEHGRFFNNNTELYKYLIRIGGLEISYQMEAYPYGIQTYFWFSKDSEINKNKAESNGLTLEKYEIHVDTQDVANATINQIKRLIELFSN